MILRKNIQFSQNFIWRNRRDLLVIIAKNEIIAKDFLAYFEKYVTAFVFNNGPLLDKDRRYGGL